ncbi:MAG: hypothetical protein ACPGRC_08825 [Salibacteraceae bacterium]
MKYLLILFSLISTLAFSQENTNSWKSFPSNDTNGIKKGKEGILTDQVTDTNIAHPKPNSLGTKKIIVSQEITIENEKYIEYAKEHPQINGFTILLYSGSGANSRLKAREVLVQFQEKYPAGVTHLSWKSPNYEVRLGDYRTKLEAQHDLELIKASFPTAFIKKAMIELPPLEKVDLAPIEE